MSFMSASTCGVIADPKLAAKIFSVIVTAMDSRYTACLSTSAGSGRETLGLFVPGSWCHSRLAASAIIRWRIAGWPLNELSALCTHACSATPCFALVFMVLA